jgi:hypothetical protein
MGYHELARALCDELGLTPVPFNYAVKYRYRGPENQGASRGELKRIFSNLEASAHRYTGQGLSFAEFCTRVRGERDFNQLHLQSGYDFFAYENLPMEAGLEVYRHLPETQSLFNGGMHGWYYMAEGLQSITSMLERQLKNVRIHYGSELTSIRFASRKSGEYRLSFTGRKERDITAGAVILAMPLQNIESVQGWSTIAPDSLPKGVQTVPLLKGFMRFNQVWWGGDIREKDTCIVADSPFRRVYLTQGSNVVWWYCDSRRAPETLALLAARPDCHLELMQEHLNLKAPDNIRIVEKGHQFWKNGNSYSSHAHCPAFNNAGFLNPTPNLFVISDALADSGWIEGSLRSVQKLIEQLQEPAFAGPVPANFNGPSPSRRRNNVFAAHPSG